LKYDRRVGEKVFIHEISEIESRDIDYPENFEIANAIYKEIISPPPYRLTVYLSFYPVKPCTRLVPTRRTSK
jgi:hypothetical protein